MLRPGFMPLFDHEDDLDDPSEAPEPPVGISGGGDQKVFLSLISRIADLRLVPCREKIPVEKGWTTLDYWRQHTPIGEAMRKWIALYGRPNFAFALGQHCGRGGDLVIEADNEAGEEWCRKNLPPTLIATLTRHGFWHRHYKPDGPDEDGFWRGNMIDVFGSKKRHEQKAIEAGFRVRIDPRQKDNEAHLAFVAKERERALAAIPMGPIVDVKCTGGQAMAPGSVHPTGFVYREVEPWTQEAWDARPTFARDWFPPEVWAERDRQRMLAASSREGLDDRIDPWWTRERRMRAGLNYARKVGAKSTGENSSGTAMRLATVLVRLLALDPPDAREIMQYWGREICAHEPWSRKELEHKLHDAQQKGRGEYGAWLKDRSRVPDARLEAAEAQIAEMISGRRQRPVTVQDHIMDLDEVELPEDHVEAIEPDAVLAPAPATPQSTPAEVVDIAHARRERGEHGAEPMTKDIVDVFTGDPLEDQPDEFAITRRPQAPAAPAGSEDQLRQVFAQYGIDIKDIREKGEQYHPKEDKSGNMVGLQCTTLNISLIFRYSKQFRGKFRMNTMTEEAEFNGIVMTDAMDAHIKNAVDALFGQEVRQERVRGAILLACDHARYDPVRNYLDSLPKWDGEHRWRRLASEVLNATYPSPEHAGVLLEKFGRAAAARALEPGCKVDTVLVLQSDQQGLSKSAFGRVLFGESFYTDQIINVDDKDSRILIAAHWCIEMAEGDIISTQAKLRPLKGFLTQSVDKIRLPYARRMASLKRRCVFIATTNEPAFLHDTTGNRRFWVVVTGSKIDLNKLAAWRDQLWAEAKEAVVAHLAARPGDEAYQRGMWWLTDEEERLNEGENATHRVEDPWLPLIEKAKSRLPLTFTIHDVLSEIGISMDKADRGVSMRVLKLLQAMGAVRTQRRSDSRCFTFPVTE